MKHVWPIRTQGGLPKYKRDAFIRTVRNAGWNQIDNVSSRYWNELFYYFTEFPIMEAK